MTAIIQRGFTRRHAECGGTGLRAPSLNVETRFAGTAYDWDAVQVFYFAGIFLT